MARPPKGRKAPDFELPTADGTSFRLSAQLGHPVVLYFYADDDTEGCTIENQEFSALLPEFEALGVTVVGITTDSKSDAAEFAARTNMGYAVVADATGRTTEDYSVTALPTVYVVDKKGVVRDVSIGFAPDSSSKLETLITQLLAEPGP